MRFSSAFFDFDGTVADTKEDVWVSLEYAANRLGGSIPEKFRSTPANLGLSAAEICGLVFPALPESGPAEFARLVAEHYRRRNPFAHTALFPGVEGLLQRCVSERMPCYIVTNKPAEPLEKILRGKGWAHYFRGWMSPDSLPGRVLAKPEMVRHLLRTYPSAGRAVLIGDTFSDIAAAKQCRIGSVGVLYGDGDPAMVLRENPDFAAHSPKEIENILFPQDREGECRA